MKHSKKDLITQLTGTFPDCDIVLADIGRLRQATRQCPFPGFVEPVAAIEVNAGKATLLALEPELLAAWISHMSYGARVRMEALEDKILAGLCDGNLLVPAILTRCHLEVAGWAAYTNQVLLRFASNHDKISLNAEILCTAYSSAMAKTDDQASIGRIPGVYSRPRSVMKAIEALQKFFNDNVGKGALNIEALYAFLCDFGHPAIMGLRAFVRTQDEADGSTHFQYQRQEKLAAADAQNLLTALLWSMRGGHANAAQMRCGEIIIEDDGDFIFEKPDPGSNEVIWQEFLQVPKLAQQNVSTKG